MPNSTIIFDTHLVGFLDPLRVEEIRFDFSGDKVWKTSLNFSNYWLHHCEECGLTLEDALRPFCVNRDDLSWETAAPVIQAKWVELYLPHIGSESQSTN